MIKRSSFKALVALLFLLVTFSLNVLASDTNSIVDDCIDTTNTELYSDLYQVGTQNTNVGFEDTTRYHAMTEGAYLQYKLSGQNHIKIVVYEAPTDSPPFTRVGIEKIKLMYKLGNEFIEIESEYIKEVEAVQNPETSWFMITYEADFPEEASDIRVTFSVTEAQKIWKQQIGLIEIIEKERAETLIDDADSLSNDLHFDVYQVGLQSDGVGFEDVTRYHAMTEGAYVEYYLSGQNYVKVTVYEAPTDNAPFERVGFDKLNFMYKLDDQYIIVPSGDIDEKVVAKSEDSSWYMVTYEYYFPKGVTNFRVTFSVTEAQQLWKQQIGEILFAEKQAPIIVEDLIDDASSKDLLSDSYAVNVDTIDEDGRFIATSEEAYVQYDISAGYNFITVTTYEKLIDEKQPEFIDLAFYFQSAYSYWHATNNFLNWGGIRDISKDDIYITEEKVDDEWVKIVYSVKIPSATVVARLYFTSIDTDKYDYDMQQISEVKLQKLKETQQATIISTNVDNADITVTGHALAQTKLTIVLAKDDGKDVEKVSYDIDSNEVFTHTFTSLDEGFYVVKVYQQEEGKMPSKPVKSMQQTVGNPDISAPVITSVRPYGNDFGKETMIEVRGTTEAYSDVIITIFNDEVTRQAYASVDYETGEFVFRIELGKTGTYTIKAFSERSESKSLEITYDEEVFIDITNVNDEANSNYTSFFEAFPSETPNIYFDTSNPKIIGDDGRYIFTNYQKGQYITYQALEAKKHAKIYGYFDIGFLNNHKLYGFTDEEFAEMNEILKTQGYYDFDFYVSQDNKTWRKANFTKIEEEVEGSSWIRVIYDLNFEDSTYLKIVFNQSFIDYPHLDTIGPYIPQLGAVIMDNRVTGEPDTEEIELPETGDDEDDDDDEGTIVDGVEKMPEGPKTTTIILIVSGAVLVAGGGYGIWFYLKRRG